MDLETYHSISNNPNTVRLISLKEWKHAGEVVPRDAGGPYMVVQEGYDPADPKMDFDEFVLGKSGEWLSVGLFLRLPRDVRRQEFVHGMAADVIHLLESLTGRVLVVRNVEEATKLGQADSDSPDEDGLSTAFSKARNQPPPQD
jgi:hypothetical protein